MRWGLLAAIALLSIEGVAQAALVKSSSVMITDDKIKLSDLFTDFNPMLDKVVGLSVPAPGQSLEISTQTLIDLATDNGLYLPHPFKPDRVTVYRYGHPVTAQSFQPLIIRLLQNQPSFAAVKADDFEVVFSPFEWQVAQRDAKRIDDYTSGRLPLADTAIEVFDQPRLPSRFTLRLPEPGLQISGLVTVFVETPVPARSIRRNEVIRADDLRLIRVQRFRLGSNTVTDPQQAIGKVAKRSLRAGALIADHSIALPVLVKKRQPVSVTYRYRNLILTGVAIALENGTLNQMITLRNDKGRQTFEAMVSGERAAVVVPGPLIAGQRTPR